MPQRMHTMEDLRFCFESYGVPVGIESNSGSVFARAVSTARSALLERMTEIDCGRAQQKFLLHTESDGECSIIRNGEVMATGDPSDFRFWKVFDGFVRILVAEHAKSMVFVHAGVVGWREHAIVLPGRSFAG